MPAICFYFQVHQPYRIRSYSYSHIGKDHHYFDTKLNAEIAKRVGKNCYLPANAILLRLIRAMQGSFKIAFSISGTAIEQMQAHCPEALDSFRDLAATGCVEFLSETYYHSLSSLYDRSEFIEQVKMHTHLMQREFNVTPAIFRNTELLYDDSLGQLISELGYRGIIVEGADDILGWRSPNFIYRVPGRQTRLIVKNYRFSDDIAFRFTDPSWPGSRLSARTFAERIEQLGDTGDLLGIFLDYETFGEHQQEENGILRFLEELPGAVMERAGGAFLTPSEAIMRYKALGELPYTRLTSWADLARDGSAWRGNQMQSSALAQIYDKGCLLPMMAGSGEFNPDSLEIWRRLQTSDHFYYMSTKHHGDGQVHSYFSPFESPYEAFIAYMNVLRDLRESSHSRSEPSVYVA